MPYVKKKKLSTNSNKITTLWYECKLFTESNEDSSSLNSMLLLARMNIKCAQLHLQNDMYLVWTIYFDLWI